ncbi:MAG: hypothetical protein AAFQ66_16015, partial [Pseudomonadota bacterium]
SPCHTSQVSIGSRATGQVVTWTHADRTRIVDQWLGKRLGGDDMLLQLCAADRTTLDVQVDHRVEPECAIAAHPAVEWQDGVGDPELWAPSQPFSATVRPKARYGSTDSFFDAYWPFSEPSWAVYQATMLSCGLPPAPGDTAPARINARIEVCRETSLQMSVTLPAVNGRKAHGSLNFDVSAEVTTEQPATPRLNHRSSEVWQWASARIHGQGLIVTAALRPGETVDFGAENSVMCGAFRFPRQITSSGTDHGAPWLESQPVSPDAVKLTHNGQTVPDAEGFLTSVQTLPKAVAQFLDDLKEAVPHVGWQADASVSAFAGPFNISWRQGNKPTADDPWIWLAGQELEFDIDSTLLSVEATAAFGMDWVVAHPLWGPPLIETVFVVRMALDAGSHLTLREKTHRVDSFNPPVRARAHPFVAAEAKATANGFGVQSWCGPTAGLTAETSFSGDLTSAPQATGKITVNPIDIGVELRPPMGAPVRERLFRYPEKSATLWQGDLLSRRRR